MVFLWLVLIITIKSAQMPLFSLPRWPHICARRGSSPGGRGEGGAELFPVWAPSHDRGHDRDIGEELWTGTAADTLREMVVVYVIIYFVFLWWDHCYNFMGR